jgi:hypothetical protein
MAERTVFQSISRKHVVSLGPQASVRDAACVMTRPIAAACWSWSRRTRCWAS